MEEVKMFLFSRWLVSVYSNEDLNKQTGEWMKERITHFNNEVYPNYQSNGSVDNTRKFIHNHDI